MKKVIVDAEGKVTIPPDMIRQCGMRPGDEVTLVEAAEGLLIYQGGVDAKTLSWWQALSREERQLAADQAQAYDQLSETEQDALWQEAADSLDDPEDDELEHPAP